MNGRDKNVIGMLNWVENIACQKHIQRSSIVIKSLHGLASNYL